MARRSLICGLMKCYTSDKVSQRGKADEMRQALCSRLGIILRIYSYGRSLMVCTHGPRGVYNETALLLIHSLPILLKSFRFAVITRDCIDEFVTALLDQMMRIHTEASLAKMAYHHNDHGTARFVYRRGSQDHHDRRISFGNSSGLRYAEYKAHHGVSACGTFSWAAL